MNFLITDCCDNQVKAIMSTDSPTQSAEQLLQDTLTQYCNWSEYPDMRKLREVLTQLSDEQKLNIQQRYSGLFTPLHCAAIRGHTEIIRTLLTSLQSSADRLKLLMIDEYTPLHPAALWGQTESVKMILDCLTAEQQIQIMSVQRGGGTAIQKAEKTGHTDTVRVLREYQQRVLTEYQHRAERLQKQQEQSRLHKSVSGRLS